MFDIQHWIDECVVGGLVHGEAVESQQLFVGEQLQFEPTRIQGKLVSIAAGGKYLFIATDKRLIIALPMNGDKQLFILPQKSSDDITHKLFCDPHGQHIIITLKSKKNFYINLGQNSRKPIELQKLKGMRIESIAWPKENTSKTMTNRLLLGTSNGCIYEYEICDCKEKTFSKLFDLKSEQYGSKVSNYEEEKDNKSWCICGLHVEKLAMPKDIGLESESKSASQVYQVQNEKLGFIELIDGGDKKQHDRYNGSRGKSHQMFYVIATIPSALYEFIGGPTFDHLFKQYNGTTYKQILTDGALNHTKLEVYGSFGDGAEACAVGWLTEIGITTCSVSLKSQIRPHSFVVGEKLTDMNDDHIIRYGPVDPTDPSDDWQGKENEIPISFVMTQFHVILVYKDGYLAINKLNRKCVHFEHFPANKYGSAKDVAVMSSGDNDHDYLIFVMCDTGIFQIRPQNEKRDVWQLYLSNNKFDNALQYATTNWQKQKILRGEAQFYFNAGSYEEAAIKFAQLSHVNATRLKTDVTEHSHDVVAIHEEDAALDVTFEEIALKFLNVGATDALMRFLTEKLNLINKNDKTQGSILATWLCEMHLAKINQSSNNVDDTAVAIDDFEEFFTQHKNILAQCKDVVSTLISSHGRSKLLIDFARSQEDWGFVVRYYVQNGDYDSSIKVLGSLHNPHDFEDLYYRFAPILMCKNPVATVNMLLKVKGLDPKRLIPALMTYDTVDTMMAPITGNVPYPSYKSGAVGGARLVTDVRSGMDFDFDVTTLGARKKSSMVEDIDEVKTSENQLNDPLRFEQYVSPRQSVSEQRANQAIRYLESCIQSRHKNATDSTIHNYLVSLYCKQRTEDALLRFIESQRKQPIFDVKYALRLCHQENKTRSCVQLYKIMKLYQEAVLLALNIKHNHFHLAKSIALEFQQVEPTKKAQQKNLWLIIAKHIVSTSDNDNVDSVLQTIGESHNVLSIEDVLPCLNNFTKIGPFKKNIKESLERYSKDIDKLQNPMTQYTKNADDIRHDTKKLLHRSAMVTSNRKCDLSAKNVLGSQFLLFPCLHVFKLDALLNKIQQHRRRNKLPLLRKSMAESQLMKIASQQCPLCGDMMIDEVTQPFVDEADVLEAHEWQMCYY